MSPLFPWRNAVLFFNDDGVFTQASAAPRDRGNESLGRSGDTGGVVPVPGERGVADSDARTLTFAWQHKMLTPGLAPPPFSMRCRA